MKKNILFMNGFMRLAACALMVLVGLMDVRAGVNPAYKQWMRSRTIIPSTSKIGTKVKVKKSIRGLPSSMKKNNLGGIVIDHGRNCHW